MTSDSNPIAPTNSTTALIIGCGYIGRRIAARLKQQGGGVFATTRRQIRAEQLADIAVRPLIMDVTQPLTFTALKPALAVDALTVYYLVPPGRSNGDPTPQQVLIDGVQNIIRALRGANLQRVVVASSTGVYGQSGTVTAETPAEPNNPRGQLLLQSENIWLDTDLPARIVRLAGLYGPDRIIGLSAVREGAPIVGDPNLLLNLIHADDAADLLIAVAESQTAADIELGSDGSPVARIEYYRELAKRLHVDPPQLLDNQAAAKMGLDVERLIRTGSRACDSAPTQQRTGWAPTYFDFRQGLDAILGVSTQR